MPVISSLGAISSRGYSSSAGNDIIATGQYLHETGGAYQWVCPSGVTSISICCIGAGGGGVGFTKPGVNLGGAGGGGSLSYKNNVRVIPGTTYILFIGYAYGNRNGGEGLLADTAGTLPQTVGTSGAYATFGITSSYTDSLCNADGGSGGRGKSTDSSPYTGVLQGGMGGSTLAMGNFGTSTTGYGLGGQGGNGGNSSLIAGGGGAGGYNAATGGRGQGTQGAAGAGGGSGAGAGGAAHAIGVAQGYTGGGVSVLGTSPGGGTLYGGGGGAAAAMRGGNGMGGAIRIMWPGISRQYPSTIVADQPTVTIL